MEHMKIIYVSAWWENWEIEIWGTTGDLLQNNFEVNVLGPIRLTQLLLPRMIQRGKGEFLVVCNLIKWT